jgi:outer membrane protein assembly factor BamB
VNWSKDLVADFGIEVPKKGHWGLSGSPLVQGNLLIVNAGRAGMAFDKASGDLVWDTGDAPAAYATPVPYQRAGQSGVLVFAAKALVALDLKTGKEWWQYPWETSWDVNAADPILAGDQVFISSGYNHGAALLNLTDGDPELVWENKNMRSQLSGGVIWQGYVYGIDDKQLRCLELATGEPKWTDRSSGKGSVTMAGGNLIVLSEKGELMVAEATPESFRPIARAQVLGGKCWTMPVLANGRIFARNAAGDVVCLDVSGR